MSLNITGSSPDSLRLGQFIVEVTGSGGHTTSTKFIVIPEGAPLVG